MPMVEYRPDAIRTSGHEHARYRQAVTDALSGIDLHTVRTALAACLFTTHCDGSLRTFRQSV